MKNLPSNELKGSPYPDPFSFDTSPEDRVVKFATLLGRPAILFERHDGYKYAIIDQKFSGHMVAHTNWDDLESITFGPIGGATKKRIEKLWEQQKKSQEMIEGS